MRNSDDNSIVKIVADNIGLLADIAALDDDVDRRRENVSDAIYALKITKVVRKLFSFNENGFVETAPFSWWPEYAIYLYYCGSENSVADKFSVIKINSAEKMVFPELAEYDYFVFCDIVDFSSEEDEKYFRLYNEQEYQDWLHSFPEYVNENV